MMRGIVLAAALAALVLPFSAGSSALADITTTGSTSTTGSTVYVGQAASSAGTLTIDGASLLSKTNGYVGYTATSTGTATVTGSGSRLTTSDNFCVGYSGNGTLNIEANGRVTSGRIDLGRNAGSSGTATVTGSGSKWTNTLNFYVGYSGSGALNIQGNGRVASGPGYVGYNAGSTGTATVTGSGSKWTAQSKLCIGGLGSGRLTVADSGEVSTGTLWASPGDLLGDGTIWANQGAVLDTDLVFDGTHGLTQTLSFGTGGTLNLRVDPMGELGVGYKSRGTLRIADGVDIESRILYLGYHSGSSGTATITGTGTTLTSDGFLLGRAGSGTLNIVAGAQVATDSLLYYLGNDPGSSGTMTVTGAGSQWTSSGGLVFIGNSGKGTLNIEAGGRVSAGVDVYIAWMAGSAGQVTVTGSGSTWTVGQDIFVGAAGDALLTVADGGKVTATRLIVSLFSAANLRISGNGMVVVGNDATAGSVNNGGKINMYADAFLAAGVYTPITEFAGRAMTWTGTKAAYAFGGEWDADNKTFTVETPAALAAGNTSYPVTTGQRVLMTDPESGHQVGAAFGNISGTPTFAATPMAAGPLAALAVTAGFEGDVLAAWDFNTTLAAGTEVFLSFDIGPGATDPQVWHYDDAGTWTPMDSGLVTYNAESGILSLSVTGFSGYAVSAVPEPATLALVAIGVAAALGGRAKKRQRQQRH